MSDFTIGLDLGQSQNYTALAVLESVEFAAVQGVETHLHVCHLERFPLGTSYPVIADRVGEVFAAVRQRGDTTLVVDATGVGRAVVDMLTRALLA